MNECFLTETEAQNLGTGPLDASINVDGNVVDGVSEFTWAIFLVKTGVSRILQTRHKSSDRPGSFSNERSQSFMVHYASHLDFNTHVTSSLTNAVTQYLK